MIETAKVITLPKKSKKNKSKRKGIKSFLKRFKSKIDMYEIVTIILGIVTAEIIHDALKFIIFRGN